MEILFDIGLILLAYFIGLISQKLFPKIFSLLPVSIFSGFVLISFKLIDVKLQGSVNNYSDFLLAIIFGIFPLSLSSFNKKFFQSVIPLWRYSLLQYLIQWGGSLLIVFFILSPLYFVGMEFGSYLPSGFAGGHGSAAVVGDLLRRGGIEDALSFTMFCATVGIIFSVIGGLLWTKLYKRKFTLREINTDFKSLSFRDILLICLLLLLSFFLKPFIYEILKLNIPAFVLAVFIALGLRKIFGARDQVTLNELTNYATDFLVIVGIGSIKFELISQQIIPLTILFLFGFFQGIMIFRFLSPRAFKSDDAFEKALFTWGWSIGGLVIGLNLVQSLESDKKSEILDEFAMTYLMLSPFEISLLLGAPWLILNGYGAYLGAVLLALAIFIITFILRKKLTP